MSRSKVFVLLFVGFLASCCVSNGLEETAQEEDLELFGIPEKTVTDEMLFDEDNNTIGDVDEENDESEEQLEEEQDSQFFDAQEDLEESEDDSSAIEQTRAAALPPRFRKMLSKFDPEARNERKQRGRRGGGGKRTSRRRRNSSRRRRNSSRRNSRKSVSRRRGSRKSASRRWRSWRGRLMDKNIRRAIPTLGARSRSVASRLSARKLRRIVYGRGLRASSSKGCGKSQKGCRRLRKIITARAGRTNFCGRFLRRHRVIHPRCPKVCPAGYVLNKYNRCRMVCPDHARLASVPFPKKCRCARGYVASNDPKTGAMQCEQRHKRCPRFSVSRSVPLSQSCQCQDGYHRRCHGRGGRRCQCKLNNCPSGYHHADKTGKCTPDCPPNFAKVVRTVRGKSTAVCVSTRAPCPTGSKKAFVNLAKNEQCECAKVGQKVVSGKCVNRCGASETFVARWNKCVPTFKKCPGFSKVQKVRYDQQCQCYDDRVMTPKKGCVCKKGTRDINGRCVSNYTQCPKGSIRSRVWFTKNCKCRRGRFLRNGKCLQKRDHPCPKGQFRSRKLGHCMYRCPPNTEAKFAAPRLGQICRCKVGFEAVNGQCLPECLDRQRRINGVCNWHCPANSISEWAPRCVCDAGFFWHQGMCVKPCPIGQVIVKGVCMKHCGWTAKKRFVAPNKRCSCKNGFFRVRGWCRRMPANGCPRGFFQKGQTCIRIMRECPRKSVTWFVNRQLGERCACKPGLYMQKKKCVPLPADRCPDGHFKVKGQCVKVCPLYSLARLVPFGQRCECAADRQPKKGKCVPIRCGKGEFRVKGVCSVRCPLYSKHFFVPAGGQCECVAGRSFKKGRCVKVQCPHGQVRINGACVYECPVGSIQGYAKAGTQCKCRKGFFLVNGECSVKPAPACPKGLVRFNGQCSARCPANSIYPFAAPPKKCLCQRGFLSKGGKCVPAPTPVQRCRGYSRLIGGKCMFRCPYNSQRKFVVKYSDCKCLNGFVMKGSFPIQHCQRIRVKKTDDDDCPPDAFMKNGVCKPKFIYCPSFSVKRMINDQIGEKCKCRPGRVLEGRICVRINDTGAQQIVKRTITTTTTTTITKRLSSMTEMHTWITEARADGRTKLADAIEEYATLQVKKQQAEAAAQQSNSAIVEQKLSQTVQQIQNDQAKVAESIEFLRETEPKVSAAEEKERQSFSTWYNTVNKKAIADLAWDIDRL